MPLKLNIEADEVLYRAAFAVERRCYKIVTPKRIYDFGNKYTKKQIITKLNELYKIEPTLEAYTTAEPVEHALHLVKTYLNKFRSLGEVSLWLSPLNGSNFRFAVAKDIEGPNGKGYKAGRKEKPIHYHAIREYLIKNGAQECFDHEADDALGMYQSENTVAVHLDKDINMIAGRHLHWPTMERYMVEEGLGTIIPEPGKSLGKAFFFQQMITGDRVDNIPGLKGYGIIKAQKELKDYKTEKEMFDKVSELYYNEFKDDAESRMYKIANLLYIVDNKGRVGADYLDTLR